MTGESDNGSTQQRIADLEDAVADLRHKLADLTETLASRAHASDSARSTPRRTTHTRQPTPPGRAGAMAATDAGVVRRRPARDVNKAPFRDLLDRGPQFWISRLGIGLVLLSVVFLFDYAIDRGWLTPAIRVGTGIVLGVALAVIGLSVRRKEPWFSQLMLGGASATWYITGFAAFQLLQLFSYPVAFAFMVAVTVFTFWAGIREDGPALGVLGAVGGLGTPVFLYTGAGSVPGLVGYTCLVLVGASGIYLVKGWRSLLWTSVVGAWSIFLIAFENLAPSDRWTLQAGVAAAWLIFWGVSAGRVLLANEDSAKWQYPRSRLVDRLSQAGIPLDRHGDIALLTVAMPVATLFFSRAVWQSGDMLWGVIALGAASCYSVVARFIRGKPNLGVLASAHIVAAAVLSVIAAALLFDNEPQLLLWTALAVVFLYLARRLDEIPLAVCGHLLSVIVGVWLLQRLTGEGRAETAVITVRGLSDAAVIVGLLVASKWSGGDSTKWYQLAAHVAFLGWLWRELAALPAGEAVVTASYGVYGLTLLLASTSTRKVGLTTLLIAVAKLFLVDLDRVDPFLRILLFLGFGALFLVISYYYRDRLPPSPLGRQRPPGDS